MRFSTIAAATGLALGATVGASYADEYLSSLYARDFDDSLYARDYDDDFLYARDLDEPLYARDAEIQSILYARDLVNEAVDVLMRRAGPHEVANKLQSGKVSLPGDARAAADVAITTPHDKHAIGKSEAQRVGTTIKSQAKGLDKNDRGTDREATDKILGSASRNTKRSRYGW
ncbi:MAG: hypothetical protein LQ340_004960 [Diploschistes diacapsis]|nr:MAG: hypothetical protein LQ340_004960 [Diploschistes diacapsis]